MTFASVVTLTGTMASFDLALLVQAFDDRREVIRVQLSRWMAQGKLIAIASDVRPFLERPEEANLLTADNLRGLLPE